MKYRIHYTEVQTTLWWSMKWRFCVRALRAHWTKLLWCFQARVKLTLSALQTSTDTFPNSVILDETARKQSSHQDLHSLLFYYWLFDSTPFSQQQMRTNSEMDEPTSERISPKGPENINYTSLLLTFVLLNPDIHCLYKQSISRSVGF